MRFREIKNLPMLICILVAILAVTFGCHAKKDEESRTKEPELDKNMPIISSTHTITSMDDLNSIITTDMSPQQAVTQTRNIVKNLILLDLSDKCKKELKEIIVYLDNINNPSVYFNVDKNIIDFMQTLVRLNSILAEIEPDNFNIKHQVAYNYINAGRLINSLAQSEEQKLISAEYKHKGLQAAKELVRKFPDKAEAYFQLAFFLITEGEKKEALELYKHCLELDPEFELCKKNYVDLQEELDSR
jgi:tetratricopeptide (TPR) repeat protein